MTRQRSVAMTLRIPLAFTLFIPTLMIAQVDRSQAPRPGPPPQVNVGNSKNSELPNGLRLIVVENHKLPMVSVQVRFDHPPILQGDIAGYQDLMGEVLTTGTARRTKEQVDETVDRLGAQLSGTSDGLFASCLKKNFKELMGLVYEVVAAPAFNAAEFEKARARYLSGLKARQDDPDQVAEVVSRALTYGKKYPYGEVPTEASVNRITRSNLVAYYQRFFRPELGYMVFVGDITEAEARKIASDLFATWKGADVERAIGPDGVEVVKNLGPINEAGAPPVARLPRQVGFVDRPGSTQSVIRVVFPVDLKPNDPDALTAQVMNTMLGGGVFNARLMQNLREKNGFTYGAYSSLDADRWCGHFSAGCSVRNAVTESAVSEIMSEIERMRAEPVTDEELTLAKNFMAGSFARSLEDPRTIARFALNTQLYGLPKDYYTDWLKRLDTISATAVHAAAQRLLNPDHATILVVGDKVEVANSLVAQSAMKAILYYDTNGDRYREPIEMPPADLNADSVLARYITAIGGRARLEKVKTLSKTYKAEVQGMSIILSEQYASPDKYAMTLENGSDPVQKIVVNGARGTKRNEDGVDDLVDEDLAEARESAVMFPELDYQKLDYGAMLNGVVDIDGRKCHRVFVKKAAGGVFTDYYDVGTGLKVRRTERKAGEHGLLEVITDFKDYKAVDGILFPHVIDQSAGTLFHFSATRIAVNKIIDPKDFALE